MVTLVARRQAGPVETGLPPKVGPRAWFWPLCSPSGVGGGLLGLDICLQGQLGDMCHQGPSLLVLLIFPGSPAEAQGSDVLQLNSSNIPGGAPLRIQMRFDSSVLKEFTFQ